MAMARSGSGGAWTTGSGVRTSSGKFKKDRILAMRAARGRTAIAREEKNNQRHEVSRKMLNET